jgi:hypothetical protein
MKGQGAVEQTEKETEGKAASGDLEEDRKVGEFKEEKTMGEKGEDGILAGITSKESWAADDGELGGIDVEWPYQTQMLLHSNLSP